MHLSQHSLATMYPLPSTPNPPLSPLAIDLRALARLIRERRRECELDLLDAAAYSDVDVAELSRMEDGQSTSTEALFKVLRGFGLEMLVMRRDEASDALSAVGHSVNWYDVMQQRVPTRTHPVQPAPRHLVLDNTTPTLFVDFDGTLHVGNAYIDDAGEITLDTGRPLLEFAPLLVELLAPYPEVEIVLTTSWARRLPQERVIAYLPPELRPRVVGTTSSIKPRRSYVLDGTERTDVIRSYAYGKRLKHWLAIDDAVFGAEQFEREPGELVDHFLLLDSTKGIGDSSARARIEKWLVDVHAQHNS
ncbi:HAD domain-containing protein [Paraburkholderia sp. CNPSo 3281]|uniref:HAD domain-containing protein n=1 Tax=Paraburkholderia sp. CNPSo 3281 TaxID=2940933 RepID=UPI0020B6EE29|nr:HAD domain-containing protein [Paraburkholderia sp. CNPSo 3281]MCP3721401.1 HAD domain-containing protein [Paraburkholderia sp. CNPSo 3281]